MLNQVVLVGTLSSVSTIKKDKSYFTITIDNEDKIITDVDCVAYDKKSINIIKQSSLDNIIGVKGYLKNENDKLNVVVESISVLDNNGNIIEYIKDR